MCVAMTDKGEASGAFIASVNGSIIELYYFCTQFHHRGHGSCLCELLFGIAAELQIQLIQCHALDNTLSFWRLMGFSATRGSESKYNDTVLMVRDVPGVSVSRLSALLESVKVRTRDWRRETHSQMIETAMREDLAALNSELQRRSLPNETTGERTLNPVGIAVTSALRGRMRGESEGVIVDYLPRSGEYVVEWQRTTKAGSLSSLMHGCDSPLYISRMYLLSYCLHSQSLCMRQGQAW